MIRLLWHQRFWDGPLTGVGEDDDGNRYWMSVTPDTEHTTHRVYEWFLLTEDEFALVEARHQTWRDQVGLHCDYVYIDGRRQRAAAFTAPEGWHDWYEEEKLRPPLPDFTDRPVAHTTEDL